MLNQSVMYFITIFITIVLITIIKVLANNSITIATLRPYSGKYAENPNMVRKHPGTPDFFCRDQFSINSQ